MSDLSQFQFASRRLDLTRPQVMGIVNVTPDSFLMAEHFTHQKNCRFSGQLTVLYRWLNRAQRSLISAVNQPGRGDAGWPG